MSSDHWLRAKRFNEHIKLISSTLNTVGLAVVGAALIIPAVAERVSEIRPFWIIYALILHLGAQSVLGFLRAEK